GDSLVLLGQCLTYGAQRPHVPVIEIVAALLSALPDGAPGADFPGRHYLEALCGEPAAAARVKDMDPATLRGRTRQAFIDGVRSAAESRPVAVIVEDLHWADPSSLEYLGALAGGLADTRGVLVASFRPGVEPPWPVAARLARVTLGPLSAAAARAMLAHLLVEQPAEAIREQVLARAEGNPFFLEELARVATSTGVDVPGDVFDVLAARIDRLAPIDKQWLRAAAVVGRDFRLDLLEEIAGGARDTLARLQPLVALGFLEPTATPRTYRFVHALTQEVAYRGMLGVERRALHSAIAERLAATAVDADDHCEDIARHHLAGARPGDALPALEAATAKALRQHALDAAHGHLSDAMRLYEAEPMVPERLVRCVTFLLHAFPIFHFLHRHHEYAALIERYAPAVEALHLPALEGPFRAQRGHRFWVQARAQHADVELQRAIALCDEAGDPVNAAHAAFLLCWLYANTGHCAEGVAYGERGLRYLAKVPVPLLLTYTHVGLLLSTLMRGWFDDADRHGRAARDIGLDAGDDGLASFGGGFLAWVLYEKGDFTGAVAEAQRAFDIAPTDYFRGWAAAWLTAARIRAGDPAADIAVLEHATAMARAAGHIFGWTLIAFLCGEAKACMGDYPGAEHALTALDEEARSMPYPFVSAGTLLVRGECALRTGRAQEALEFFKRAEHEYAAIDCAHRAAQARTGVARAMDTLG
ncbi:MAG: AAA family ATPase, partial [Gammaproteobacteria bacterium]